MLTSSFQRGWAWFPQHTPYLAFILIFAWYSVSSDGWQGFLFTIVVLGMITLPIMLCKHFSSNATGKATLLWWIVGFIGIPLLHLLLHENLDGYNTLLSNDLTFFLWLIAIELMILLLNNLKPLHLAGLKQKLTMDNIALGLVLFFSLMWSLVFNSVDEPMQNQPIHVLIDIKRNILRFDEFLAYFIQFFLIYFTGFVIYWVNHHILINKVMARFGVFHYLWSACIFTLIASPTLSQLLLFLPINDYEFTLLPSGNQDPFDNWNLRIAFILMAISLPLILAFKWQQKMAEVATLKQQNTQAELKWLQQQINPHFLFNTLNNLYSLTLAKSDEAPNSILQLSNLLRFVVYKGGEERVSLQEELGYLNDYVALQQMRVKHKSQISFSVEGELEDYSNLFIAPLMLVVLLENAFKHGIDASDQSSWLKVNVSFDHNQLNFDCRNSVDARISQQTNEDGGVGLANLKRRLELAYPDTHRLDFGAKDSEFHCHLQIELESDGKP